MNKKADVSVIIPYFNNSSTIYRTIISVYNQTLLPKEIIVIDDFSNKREKIYLHKILKLFDNKKIKINLIRNKQNFGPGTSRNYGWNKASSKYVAFLDSDDSWHIKKIEIQYNFMKKNNITFSAHKSTYKYQDTFNNYRDKFSYKIIKPFWMFLFNQFTTPTVMLKKSVKLRFQDKKYYTEDYLLWLKIILHKKIYFIDLTLTYLHKASIGISGLSKNIDLMRKGEIETYAQLYEEKFINLGFYNFLLFFSFLKNIRRKLFFYVYN
jgi:glycosyltransferase involved in cell wall biosynthesis